ncbi:MAG: S41 family peptidase [Candidatus Melainabacteria bacterium]|nr:S41 family peptidase [Candidatus Melainabacteria bacterium]
MKTKLGLYAAAIALLLSADNGFAQQPDGKPLPAPSLHELLQGENFPLGVPVPETPDPVRLYKEGINTIAKEHIALTGHAEETTNIFMGFWGGSRPVKKTKMQVFQEKWEKPPFELKSLDDADRAIKLALTSLDHRFDSYLVPKEVKLEDKRIDNTNVGIGIIIRMENTEELLKALPRSATEDQVDKALIVDDRHYLTVSPVRNGPAAKGGMLEGDVIKEVDGKPINGKTYKDAIKPIGGKKGTKVDITVEREEKGVKVLKKLTIERNEYEVPVVTLKHLGDDVWHLHLETFSARNAAKDVRESLDEVMKKGGKKLIFDLRDNGGGLVDQAIEIGACLLPEGTIVTQQHRLYGGSELLETQSHVTKHVFLETRPQANGQLPIIKQRTLSVPATMPIVVLVNGNSASASELVSGALRFNNRVKMVGTRTFGKGVGQSLIDLPYGRRLHVTSLYFLPADRFTDWVGVDVDVEAKVSKDDKTDVQLDAAVKTVNEMYLQGIKDAADKLAHDTRVREENKAAWQKRLEMIKKFEEEKAKKEAEDKAKKEAADKAAKEPQKDGKPEAPSTTPGAEPVDTPANPGAPPALPVLPLEVLPPIPMQAPVPHPVPTDPTNPTVTPSTPGANPLIDPKPGVKPGSTDGSGN